MTDCTSFPGEVCRRKRQMGRIIKLSSSSSGDKILREWSPVAPEIQPFEKFM